MRLIEVKVREEKLRSGPLEVRVLRKGDGAGDGEGHEEAEPKGNKHKIIQCAISY